MNKEDNSSLLNERKSTGKKRVITPMVVTFADGSMKRVCCGIAARRALINGAIGIIPQSEETIYGTCCHEKGI